VHEIVHPFVEANFPACPAWFNEGLGSLYEQSAERNGRIVGLTNWRLRGLQEAVRKDQLPSFRELCTTTTSEFYYEDKGTNYAQARYLCYYLQEAGLLEKYYHAFRAAHQKDPSGYETLKAVLQRDEEGMKAVSRADDSRAYCRLPPGSGRLDGVSGTMTCRRERRPIVCGQRSLASPAAGAHNGTHGRRAAQLQT